MCSSEVQPDSFDQLRVNVGSHGLPEHRQRMEREISSWQKSQKAAIPVVIMYANIQLQAYVC